MFVEVAPGVLVRQSLFCESNAVVVRDSDDTLLVDPGVTGDDLNALADEIEDLGIIVTMGFSTHPHWDHLLWHARFGDVPRYGTLKCATTARERLERNRALAARLAPGAPLETLDRVTALQPDANYLPWQGRRIQILEHDGHAPGHGALLVEDLSVLIAGDMLSDVEIPLFDPRGTDACGDYVVGLDLLASASAGVVIPGHGSVGYGSEVGERIEADRTYVRAVLAGVDPTDERLGSGATYGTDWLPQAHQSNVDLANQRSARG
jgi:glyoxylase-like metal-dependent hydrolase (beta-lactamase superfamily II)